jgi:anaerobic magnesium-protoporphyrin IX monomethyl ester cyclase
VRVALIRYHEDAENTRQLKLVVRRAGVLPHLGLGYIHTALSSAGHDVVTLDAQALRMPDNELAAALKRLRPQLVGVTTTTPGLPGALIACRLAKNVGAYVILGGPHTEVFGRENLHHSFIDAVGVGEGVTIMVGLAGALANGDPPESVQGVGTRTQDGTGAFAMPVQVVRPTAQKSALTSSLMLSPSPVAAGNAGGAAPMLPLQEMGWPDRAAVPMHRYYSLMAKRPFATMISSRGCPFKCSFCFKQSVDKLKSVFREAEDIVAEMTYLVRKCGVREIMFYDDVFTMKKSRVYEICDHIRSQGLKVRWEAPTRVDLVDGDLLRAMAQAGCIRLRYGIESGDPAMLKRMRKESNLSIIEEAVVSAKQAGIQTFAYFIVGYLNETDEQYSRTVNLACRLPIDYASFYTATPLPGTALHEEAVAAGAIPPDYWLRFVRGETTQRLSFLVPNAEERSRAAYKKFYIRRTKARMLLGHMAAPRSTWSVATALLTLMRADSNYVRDC